MAKVLFILLLLTGFLPLLLDSKFTSKQVRYNRTKRQAPIGILNPPIPTSIAHFIGNNQVIDKCPRNEVLMPYGNCYPLLNQGPCSIHQYILLDPADNKPYCAERLCGPDRIFIFSDQQCHDPRNIQLCPPGRQLYQSSFGTPICQCPTGTYEGDDDLDDDVCENLLGQSLLCPQGQVFWFKDFSLPPECVPDPCGGENLNRGPNDQPFVPFSDGRCFQLGTMPNVCPAQTWYTIALERLQGVCSSLEDASYEVFDPDTLAQLIEIYGPPIARDSTAPIPVSPSGSASSQTQGAGGGAGFGSQGGSGQGTFSQVAGSQGTLNGGSAQGTFSQGAGSQGTLSGGSGIGGQGVISQGSQGTFGQGVGTGSQGTFGQTYSSPGSGLSPRPSSFFTGITGGTLPYPGSSSLTINQGQPSGVIIGDQSMEYFGVHNDGLSFRTPSHSQIGSVIGDVKDLEISEGHLIADIDVGVPGSILFGEQRGGGPVDDVDLLQAPPGHELHGFFNSVRTLVNTGPHNRSRRTPLPHAAPGNVFETRLVGCRAGAQRDINAKCRNTVLPSRTPASRPARAAPSVNPSPGCPSGQAFNIRRMCEASGNAVNSINRNSLG